MWFKGRSRLQKRYWQDTMTMLTFKVQLESLPNASPNRLSDLRFEVHFA